MSMKSGQKAFPSENWPRRGRALKVRRPYGVECGEKITGARISSPTARRRSCPRRSAEANRIRRALPIFAKIIVVKIPELTLRTVDVRNSTISLQVFAGDGREAVRAGVADMTFHRSLLMRIFIAIAVLAGAVSARAAVEETQSPAPHNRLAIVIGNSSYGSGKLPHLANAVNDANKLSESLSRLNFDVMTGTDLSRAGLEKLFSDAAAKLPRMSAVLIFYAGHGVQIQGENYLLPTDTDPDSLDALKASSIKLNDVIARFASRDRQTFIFLDACRNNPLAGTDGAGNGLAQVEVGENSFVAFATQPGNVTVDGAGDNSPFTTALAKNIEIPGLSISDMMIRVRNETEALTVGRQVPWDQSNLREQFYFTEEQTLDPAKLSASLSRILADPVAKQKLQIELASNDLQTAVLIVGQTLRSIDMADETAAPKPATGGTQVASLTTEESIEGARQSVVSGLQTLIVGGSGDGAAAAATDGLARNVQTELRRLGCYRMDVDGDWGKGSVRALTDYYRNRKMAVSSTEPTVELLSDLFLQSGRVCKQPVIIKAKPETKKVRLASDGDQPSGKAAKAGKRAQKSQANRRPAAPPPDISGGIGIGGIF